MFRIVFLLAFAPSAVFSEAAGTVSGRVFTNSLGMEFVRVEPGHFTMGEDSASADYDERPAHHVKLTTPFYVLSRRISQAEIQRAGLSGSATNGSWNVAAQFCVWLSKQEGRTYRLPTEAEWGYVYQNRQGGKLSEMAELAGREWVQDWHGLYPPDDVEDPTGPAIGVTKVIREGNRRFSLSPDAAASPWGLETGGFRVVLVIQFPKKPFRIPPPYAQAAVKHSPAPALQGPDEKTPYFVVRFALPIPPDNDTNLNGSLVGIDPSVMAHQHSPGFEILPNGDALAVYFSARNSSGASECDTDTRFVQARLRYGSEQWDPPELFCDFKPLNDQSGLLWRDGATIRFFGGGRGASDWLPFRMAVSTNDGGTWNMSLPHLDLPATNYTAQPIVNAFRSTNRAMFFAMDGTKDSSFLWRSLDGGLQWHDMGGRTWARHSTIVPLDQTGRLLSLGGKNGGIDGWSPKSISTDWGATWSSPVKSPFPALGANQRSCLIRLANGHLCFVSDSYRRKSEVIPEGWKYGQGCFVAISTDNGDNWHIKRFPVELPHESDRKRGTLGYATVRQAPNGVIHVLATMTQPCLHYEFNEAWVFSNEGDVPPELAGGRIETYRETYPSGVVRAEWSARICPGGRYLLEGQETTYYESGQKEHEASYIAGRKTGEEQFWNSDGIKLWSSTHDPAMNVSTWTQYWRNGKKRLQSKWDTFPKARDLDRRFFGLSANGPAIQWIQDGSPAGAFSFTNGSLAGPLKLTPAQR